MNTKRFALGVLVGTIALFAIGYLMFEVAFASFYAANVGSATGLLRESTLWWASVLQNLSEAVLLMLALNWTRASSIAQGLKIGAIVGFLVWFTADFGYYGFTNAWNLTVTMVDPFLELVHHGIGGAVIVAVIGRDAPSGSTGAGNP
jgi:hypothetical protein